MKNSGFCYDVLWIFDRGKPFDRRYFFSGKNDFMAAFAIIQKITLNLEYFVNQTVTVY